MKDKDPDASDETEDDDEGKFWPDEEWARARSETYLNVDDQRIHPRSVTVDTTASSQDFHALQVRIGAILFLHYLQEALVYISVEQIPQYVHEEIGLSLPKTMQFLLSFPQEVNDPPDITVRHFFGLWTTTRRPTPEAVPIQWAWNSISHIDIENNEVLVITGCCSSLI